MPRSESNIDNLNDGRLYSDAVVAGGFVYTTGQMPLDADWQIVSEDFTEQAQFVFDRLGKILAECGSSPEFLVRLTIYLADIKDTVKLAPLRSQFLGKTRPASVIMHVGKFGTPGMLLEAEAVAVLPEYA